MPPAAYFEEKARTPLRSMTIVDLKFHAGEVFVAGVSNQEFSSTLRRIPYPFTGAASETQAGDLPPRPRHLRDACADPGHAVRRH